MSTTASRLTKARIALLLDHPLLGQVILHLEMQEASSWCPTAATDGRYFYYNTAFVESLNDGELLFLCGHEVLHCVFQHMFRRGERDPLLWNYCADALINHLLVADKVGVKPSSAIYDQRYSSETYTVEQLYALLEKRPPKLKQPLDMHLDVQPQNGEPDDQSGPDQSGEPAGPLPMTAEEIAQVRDLLEAALIEGLKQQEAREPGSVPAGLRRLVQDLLNPRIDWRVMLADVIQDSFHHDYSYIRTSRRSWSSGLVLPGQDVAQRVDVTACLDGSASTTAEMITDFMTECIGIVTSFQDFRLLFMTFDTEVYNVIEFTPDNVDELYHYEFRGNGGTRPSCCWRYLRDHGIIPGKLLIFTDGEFGNDWGDPMFCDTLFIIHSNPHIEAPYGQTTHYERRASDAQTAH